MGAKAIKFLEENIGPNLPDLGFGSGFLAMTSRRGTAKEKNKLGIFKIKSVWTLKNKKMKR